jgi:hypothetical protein
MNTRGNIGTTFSLNKTSMRPFIACSISANAPASSLASPAWILFNAHFIIAEYACLCRAEASVVASDSFLDSELNPCPSLALFLEASRPSCSFLDGDGGIRRRFLEAAAPLPLLVAFLISFLKGDTQEDRLAAWLRPISPSTPRRSVSSWDTAGRAGGGRGGDGVCGADSSVDDGVCSAENSADDVVVVMALVGPSRLANRQGRKVRDPGGKKRCCAVG